jgi:hypothetical protein
LEFEKLSGEFGKHLKSLRTFCLMASDIKAEDVCPLEQADKMILSSDAFVDGMKALHKRTKNVLN